MDPPIPVLLLLYPSCLHLFLCRHSSWLLLFPPSITPMPCEQMYSLKEANFLVEEFMLLANITVAKKILRHFPTLSILRRHPSPTMSQFDALRSRFVWLDEQIWIADCWEAILNLPAWPTVVEKSCLLVYAIAWPDLKFLQPSKLTASHMPFFCLFVLGIPPSSKAVGVKVDVGNSKELSQTLETAKVGATYLWLLDPIPLALNCNHYYLFVVYYFRRRFLIWSISNPCLHYVFHLFPLLHYSEVRRSLLQQAHTYSCDSVHVTCTVLCFRG